MNNEYTIHYPKSLNMYSALYCSINTPDIENFIFSTSPALKCRDYKIDGGLWQLTMKGSIVPLYLDRESYIITPEGVKFEFSEFPRFAKYIAYRNLERDIEVLE